MIREIANKILGAQPIKSLQPNHVNNTALANTQTLRPNSEINKQNKAAKIDFLA